MYELALDDVSKARNKKYGFNNTCVVLKGFDWNGGSIVLVKSVKMSYYTPKGRARLGVDVTYHVYRQGLEREQLSGSRFHFTNKSEAMSYFKALKNETIAISTCPF